jgi:hypothetical protein
MTTNKREDEEMLKRLERLQRQTGAAPGLAKAKDSANDSKPKSTLAEAEQALEEAKRAGRVFNEVAGVWDTVTKPIKIGWSYAKPTYEIGKHAVIKAGEALSFLAPVAKPLWNGYMALFNRAAYTKDENGDRTVLNKPRALAAVALSLMVAFTGATQGLPFAGNMLYDGTMMATTTQIDQPVYLTGANPYDNSDDIFYVKGCEELPCTDSNSVLYRVRDNFLLSAYRFTTTGHAFWPEDVGAAIPEETSACLISTYGVRNRILGMYPHITSVQCAPNSAQGQPGTFPTPVP